MKRNERAVLAYVRVLTGRQKCLNATVPGTSSKKRGRRSVMREEGWRIIGKAARGRAFMVEVKGSLGRATVKKRGALPRKEASIS